MEATPGNKEQAPFVPFTKAERIQQLGEIDESIVSLLRTVGQAIQSLGKKDPTDGDTSMGGDEEDSEEDEEDEDMDEETARQKAIEKAKYKGKAVVFKHEMNEFLRTLHSVNIRMKRQIWGLEEAGIVKLSKDDEDEDQAKKQLQQQQKKKKPAGLEPDGNGKIGGINVGWLNTRSNKVERDMESELWDQAEAFLRNLLERGEDSNGDSHMSQ